MFLAGFSVLFESKSRRQEIALFMSPKCMEAGWNMLGVRGFLGENYNPAQTTMMHKLLFAICVGILSIGSIERENYIKPTYENILKRILH